MCCYIVLQDLTRFVVCAFKQFTFYSKQQICRRVLVICFILQHWSFWSKKRYMLRGLILVSAVLYLLRVRNYFSTVRWQWPSTIKKNLHKLATGRPCSVLHLFAFCIYVALNLKKPVSLFHKEHWNTLKAKW